MTTRVAHVVTRCIAGAGGVAVRGAMSLPPSEYSSVLITGSGDELLDQARGHGIDVVVLPELVPTISPRDDLRAVHSLRSLFRRGEIDVVHTHSSKAGAIGRVAARWAGVRRIVHTIHGFPFHQFQSPPVRGTYVAAERALGSITDVTLAVGTAVAVEAIRRGIARPESVVTIGPAVDPVTIRADATTRAAARRTLGIPETTLVIGTVGRMDYQKAPEVMLDAVGRLTHPATLVWLGGGPQLEEMRARAEQLGLGDRVHFLGHRRDVADLLPAFDVFALSSRYEGLPCAIVEAQECGLPVVATQVNGVPDVVIPGETGLLVRPQQPAELARALDFALAHPDLRRSWVERASQRLGDRYGIDRLGDILQQAYRPHLAPVSTPAVSTAPVPTPRAPSVAPQPVRAVS